MHGIVIYVYTLVQNIEKNIGTLQSDKLSFSSPCTEFLHSLQVQFSFGKNVATDSISSVSMPLKNASWGTDKIKLRYFVYLVSDIRNTQRRDC